MSFRTKTEIYKEKEIVKVNYFFKHYGKDYSYCFNSYFKIIYISNEEESLKTVYYEVSCTECQNTMIVLYKDIEKIRGFLYEI